MCRVERTGCASHCPERLRGFFVYTGGSVLLVETHALSPNRATSGRNPFLTHPTVSGSSSFSRSHLQLIYHVRSCDRRSAAAQIRFRSDTSRCLSGSVGNRVERRGCWDFLRLQRGFTVGLGRLNERGGAGLEWSGIMAHGTRRLFGPGCTDPARSVFGCWSGGAQLPLLFQCPWARFVSGENFVCDAAACMCAVRVCVCCPLIVSKCCCTSSWTLVP